MFIVCYNYILVLISILDDVCFVEEDTWRCTLRLLHCVERSGYKSLGGCEARKDLELWADLDYGGEVH